MSNEISPDLSLPFNCFDAAFWALRYGVCAALDGDSRWALLTTLYSHLPIVEAGTATLARESGLSVATVKRCRKALKLAGLIDFVSASGGDRDKTISYSCADIRQRPIVDRVVACLKPDRVHGDPGTGVMANPVHNEPGSLRTPYRVHGDPSTGVMVNPKVSNKGSKQVPTGGPAGPDEEPTKLPDVLTGEPQTKCSSAFPPSGLNDTPGHPAGQQALSAEPSTGSNEPQAEQVPMGAAGTALPDDPIVKLAYWFGYGKPAETAGTVEQLAKLKPTQTNWFSEAFLAGEADYLGQVSPDAEPVQIAAWAWTVLQIIRRQHGRSVVRPGKGELMGDKGRGGIIRELLTQRGPAETIALVQIVCNNHEEILTKCQGLDHPPGFDDSFFRHKMVRRLAEQLLSETAPELEEEFV